MTAKSAGSPAFLPPELCVARHGDVSGKAADIWAMGVTLYCLKYGKLPFKRDSVLDMYEAIRNDELEVPEDEKPEFRDLITRLLDKDASTRICMSEIRVSLHSAFSGYVLLQLALLTTQLGTPVGYSKRHRSSPI